MVANEDSGSFVVVLDHTYLRKQRQVEYTQYSRTHKHKTISWWFSSVFGGVPNLFFQGGAQPGVPGKHTVRTPLQGFPPTQQVVYEQ